MEIRSDRKIVHKAALVKMIKVLSGDMDVSNVEEWLDEQGISEEDEITVCELFEQYERRGRDQGRAEGRAEGERLGMEKGENRFAGLIQLLIDGGRNDEVGRAAADPAYREQLYAEANL